MQHLHYFPENFISIKDRNVITWPWHYLSAVGVLLLLFLSSPANAQNEAGDYRINQRFTSDQLREDLAYYKTRLEQDHPNLYLYTSKSEINRLFDSLSATLVVDDNSLNFYNLITLLLPAIKDGHTHIFPDPSTMQYMYGHSPYLPLEVHWEGNRLFVIREYTARPQIAPGTEIIMINNVNSSFMYDIMMRRQIRDGYNLTYPAWIVEHYFRGYYSLHLGNPKNYKIIVLNPDRTIGEVTIKGLPADSILYYSKSLYNEATGKDLYGTGLTLTVDTALHAGTITIKDFDNENLRIVYNQEFDKVIPEFFSEVRNRHLEYLILDLRGNQGGDLKNGILLLSNLLDTTFQVVRSYESVDPTTCHIPEARLQPAKGPEAGYHEPVKKNFSGKLFVLINGGTYSASSIVCSVLQQADRCTFIGEETGGNPVVIAGEGKHIQLPNTKTDVLIPSLRYNIRSILFNSGRGITPDHLVVPSTEDILQHRDPAMELAYRLISNKVKSEK